MITPSGNNYNIVETRTPTETIWSLADKTPYKARQAKTKSKLAELKELEAELAEIKKLAQELMDSGEIDSFDLDFLEEDAEEDEQAVLNASKQPLDFDVFVESLGRKNKEVIDFDKFNDYMNTACMIWCVC